MTDPMDLVRQFYRAVNRRDADAIAAFYHPACIVERVFIDDEGVIEGRGVVAERWRDEFARYAGCLPGGHRVSVERVAGLETGWGWVRADWLAAVGDDRAPRHISGYSHFWIEDGLIRRHRSVAREVPADTVREATPTTRHYPERPIVGVGAVVLADDGQVVLVKRRHEPLAGQWSLPGGMLELGETLEAGVAREIAEETGLAVDVGPVIEVFDRILVDDAGRVRYHFVLVDYLCRPRGGALAAGSDVSEVVYADPERLAPFRVTEKTGDVVARALAIRER
ncbi:MAG TPA: NUDIX domain-containing protein [Vicinamibacterales bacterium]|nr:NUDIX domain-containing protein [Vicinamibacterales bacterium]